MNPTAGLQMRYDSSYHFNSNCMLGRFYADSVPQTTHILQVIDLTQLEEIQCKIYLNGNRWGMDNFRYVSKTFLDWIGSWMQLRCSVYFSDKFVFLYIKRLEILGSWWTSKPSLTSSHTPLHQHRLRIQATPHTNQFSPPFSLHSTFTQLHFPLYFFPVLSLERSWSQRNSKQLFWKSKKKLYCLHWKTRPFPGEMLEWREPLKLRS